MGTMSRRAVFAAFVGVVVIAACSNDQRTADESIVTSTTSEATTSTVTTTARAASSTVSATSAPTSTTVAATTIAPATESIPLTPCDDGELPVVAAYDRDDGAPVWTACTDEPTQPVLLGATDDVVMAMLTPRPGASPSPSATISKPQLVALDAATGAQRWRHDHSPFTFTAPGPIAGSDTIVAVLDDAGSQAITGIDPADGTVRWELPVTGEPSLIASTDDVVVATDPDAFSTSSGSSTNGPPATLIGGTEQNGSGRLEAYIGIDRATGTRLWTTKLGAPESMTVPGPPRGAAGDGIAIVALGPSALDLRTGTVRWTATLPPNEQPLDPAPDTAIGPVVAGSALFGGQHKQFLAIDSATGQPRWTAAASTVFDDVWAVGVDSVFLVEGADIVAYDLVSGVERWRQPQGDGYVWPWLADDDTVFTMWWNLEARDAATGTVRWSTTYPIASPPTEGRRMVTAASDTNHVYVGFIDATTGGD